MNKKLTDKDKKDWQKFVSGNEKLADKENLNKSTNKVFLKKTIDLHGYSLENANNTIEKFIEKSYLNSVTKIVVITGKGKGSKIKENPYKSDKYGILKYSVPEYISSCPGLKKKIKKINLEDVNNPLKGSFEIILNKFKG